MIDVQNETPENEIELEKVGVEGLKKYVVVRRPNQVKGSGSKARN